MLRIAVVTPYFPVKQEHYQGHSAYQTVKRMMPKANVRVFCPVAEYPKWFRPRSYRYYPPAPEFSPKGVDTRYISYPCLPVVTRPVNGYVCYRNILPAVRDFNPSIILN